MRPAGPALLALVALAGCGAQVRHEDQPEPVAVTTTTTIPPEDLGMERLLIRIHDLDVPDYEVTVQSRRFNAATADRILLCGEDLREESGVLRGRQSRFSDGQVELTDTVTVGGDAEALVGRFRHLTTDCPGTWTEPELPIGGGPVRREITGIYPLPDLGPNVTGASAIIRSTNQLGSSDTIVVVLARGTLVSALSASGPLGADFAVVDPAIQAAARRLGQTEGSP